MQDMDRRTLLISRRDEILALAERREAKDIRTFWSAARSEPRADSDVDPQIDPAPGRRLLDPGGLAMDLSPPTVARSMP